MISNLEKMFENLEYDMERKYMKIGIRKGFEQGIEQGIEKVARRMLGLGMDIPIIIEATGLTSEQAEALKKKD
jgi:predicted transposase/invertase (TIGR01784 family)